LRQIEADTPVHRLWAGTKLVAAAGLSLTVSLSPSWPTVAASALVLIGGSVLARVPWSAVPRPPLWFWVALLAGAVLTVISGGAPEIAVGAVHIGLGNLASYALFTAVSFLLVGAGVLIGWTTPLGDLGPAIGRLLAPLRLLRVPTDEWAIAIALCIRSLPLLMDEIRTLLAARRLRPSPSSRHGLLRHVDEAGEILLAMLSVSLRRATEMGEAMTARGGTASITGRAPGPRGRDAVAILVVACVCGGGVFLSG
jgi:energy-coupling factor transport system permease protein